MGYEETFNEWLTKEKPDINEASLSDVLYTVSEMVGWCDYVDSVSVEQAILCWKIVKTLETKALPRELIL